MTDIFSALATRKSPQQAYFDRMLAEGTNTSPIQSSTQGFSRLAHALLAGLELRGQRDEEKAAQALRMNLPGLEVPTASGTPTASAAPASPIANALAGPKQSRIYDQNEVNPIDAQIMTPEQLAHGVPDFVPQQYRSVMGKAAIDQDLPSALLARQTRQESGFNPNAVSKAGAQGISQFMPGTANEMGINPADPNQAIPAQAAYLRQNIDKFGGSVPLGLAAYNYGPGNVEKVGGDVSRMPAETQNYIRTVGGPQQPQQTAQADPAALPPNAQPTQFMVPGQPQGQGAAIPARSPVQIDPQMAQKIREMIGSKDPAIQQQGFELYKQFAKPREETRPLTDPRERAAKGIQPTDTNPYQVDAKGEVKPINPQPFAVNVNQQQESEYKKEAGGLTAKRHNEYVKQAGESREISADIGALRDIGSRIPGGTGKTAEITAALGPYAEALGIKIDGLGDMQAYNAIVSKMQPRMRVAGSGATSDYEMGTFLKAIPSLGKTPDGNKIIEDVTDALHQHRLAVGEIAGQALDGTMSPSEADKKIRALPDPMKLWKEAKGKLPSERTTGGAPSVDDLLKKYGPK